MRSVNEEIDSVRKIMGEDNDLAPDDALMAKFREIVERYRGRAGNPPWTPLHGWVTVEVGNYVQLVYDSATGYQMKTLLNSKAYGYAEVEDWETQVGQAKLILTRFRENKIPVKM